MLGCSAISRSTWWIETEGTIQQDSGVGLVMYEAECSPDILLTRGYMDRHRAEDGLGEALLSALAMPETASCAGIPVL